MDELYDAERGEAVDDSHTKSMANTGTEGSRRCCIHSSSESDTSGKVTLFNEDTLSDCASVLEVRKENSLKYKEFHLPVECDGIVGFHMDCYRRFTALSKKHRSQKSSSNSSSSNTPSSSSKTKRTGKLNNSTVLEKKCLICDKKVITVNQKKHQLTKVEFKSSPADGGKFFFQESLMKYALMLNDSFMIGKIAGLNLGAKEAWYHRICRSRYQIEAESKQEQKEETKSSHWHEARNLHNETFGIVRDFIQENVINRKEAYYLSELCELYRSNLRETNESDQDVSNYKSDRLSKKIEDHFKEKIIIQPSGTHRGKIVYSSEISFTQAMDSIQNNEHELEQKVREVAFALRDKIKQCKKRPLPEDLKVEDVLQGEVDTPALLKSFYSHLIMGPRLGRGESDRKRRRVDCLSQDAIFAVTDGKVKPRKHLKLGMAMRKLGGKKVTRMLSRCGYIPSYNKTEEIETELAFSCTGENQHTPYGMLMEPGCGTGVAFDNFDRQVETMSGKDTLHDTVGIAYQYVITDATDPSTSENNTEQIQFSIERKTYRKSQLPEPKRKNIQDEVPTVHKAAKRRRTFESNAEDLEPYRKKPKMTCTLSSDGFESLEPADYKVAVYKDLLWIMYLYCNQDKAIMWTGWNSKEISISTAGPQQKVWYLEQINQSPTSTTVVRETLRRALKVLDECKLNSIPVTFDLAIAKLAYRIQATESPEFDKVFINLGAFHIELAYFNVIGKYIAESGGPFVLTESGVLASGSMNGFIKGKHYNRCKRIHMLFVAALQLLHLQEFLSTDQDNFAEIEIIKDELNKINEKLFSPDDLSRNTKEILKKYEEYISNTLNGSHGVTGQYWMGYVQMIDYWLQLSRSIREGNFDLYTFSLKNIAKYFFVFNQPNYARWLLEYISRLLKLKDTHPEVEREFRLGAFGVRRSNKSFSRSPIDLTLEQTINADAAGDKSGISHFTNSISARQRWAKTHSVSVTILSSLLEDLGLTNKEDVSRELKPSRIQQNSTDLRNIIDLLQQSMNPFSPELDSESLFNIGSGKAASDQTKDFLLNVAIIGQTAQDQFIGECTENKDRFEQESIKRIKMSTFANEGAKRKVTINGKVKEVKMERDLFGKILFLALERKIDMAMVLTYPLTPLPLSFCHYDGTLRDTSKSKLSNEIKKSIQSSEPGYIDVYIIDGNFYLYLLTDLPVSFSGVSRKILAKICALKVPHIDLVFDQIQCPSIKDYERDQRSSKHDRSLNYQILGGLQRRPANFREALRNDAFKDSLIGFLVESWNDDSFADLIGEKVINVTHQTKCFQFTSSNGQVIREEIPSMQSTHEEADCRMFFHLHSLPDENKHVVIRSNDADVLIIALAQASILKHNLWIEQGFSGDNSLEYIHVNHLIDHFGLLFCEALPALHAFTGCDYTPAFSGRGKVKPMITLHKSVEFQNAFATLAKSQEVTVELVRLIEHFVCKLYGNSKNIKDVNSMRYKKFTSAYRPQKKKAILAAKSVNSISMPPCSAVLYQQILRSCLISATWLNAHYSGPPNMYAPNYGFDLVNGKYYPKWHDGDITPPSIETIAIPAEYEADEEEDDQLSDEENDLSDDEMDNDGSDDDY